MTFLKKAIFLLLFLALFFSTLSAKDVRVKKVLIIPFSINTPENATEYLKNAIFDMLSSRLFCKEEVEVIDKYQSKRIIGKVDTKNMTKKLAIALGKKAGADFVIYGSVTKIGQGTSIDARVVETRNGEIVSYVYETGARLDEIVPKIDMLAKEINHKVFGKEIPKEQFAYYTYPPPNYVPPPYHYPTYGTKASPPKEKNPYRREKSLNQPRGVPVVVKEKIKKSKKVEVHKGVPIGGKLSKGRVWASKKGIWVSQSFSHLFKGMDIGDVNNDGKNEIVLVDDKSVYVYQKQGQGLKLLAKLETEGLAKLLGVDVADINENGTPEIFVTSISKDILNSFVIEYRNGKFKKIATNIPYFLRVVETPNGKKKLFGQELSLGGNCFMKPKFFGKIYELSYNGGKYTKTGKSLGDLFGYPVYSFAMADFDGDGNIEIATIDGDEKLRLLTTNGKETIWRSKENFGLSNNFVDFHEESPAPETTKGDKGNPNKRMYLTPRLLSYDLDGDGVPELITVRNRSSTGKILERARIFDRSEIYDLYWNGYTMAINWNLEDINGYVADFQIKDFDNDGKADFVLTVNQSGQGIISFLRKKSFIVVYKMG